MSIHPDSNDLIHEMDRTVVFGSGGGATIIAEDAVHRMFRFGINISCTPLTYPL